MKVVKENVTTHVSVRELTQPYLWFFWQPNPTYLAAKGSTLYSVHEMYEEDSVIVVYHMDKDGDQQARKS